MNLLVSGFIKEFDDRNHDIKFSPYHDYDYTSYGLCDYIQKHIERKCGVNSYCDRKKRLGRNIDIINQCRLRVFFTKQECTIEEADIALAEKFTGRYYSDVDLVGWSEYTITGYCVNKCQIGGHNLVDICSSHIGDYMIIEMEW